MMRALVNLVVLAARAIVWLADRREAERPKCISCSRTLRSRRERHFSRCSPCLHRLRGVLYSQQEGQCGICRRPLARRGYSTPWNIDHIHPKAHGGADDDANLQLVHGGCNWQKGNG